MKTDRDYFSRVQECMLLFLTNAAFLIQISLKDETLHPLLQTVSESSEKCAYALSEILKGHTGTHLNPAFLRKATGETQKDLRLAKADFLNLHRSLLLLSAYAPDASVRKIIMKLSADTQKSIDLLKFIS